MHYLADTITNPALDKNLTDFLDEKGSISFFNSFFPRVVGLLFVGGAIVFLAYLLIGGLGWITAGGDKAKVEEARSKVTSAIIGFVVLGSVFAIVKLVEVFFGLNILTLDIGVLKIE